MPPTVAHSLATDHIADLRRLAAATESGKQPVESVKHELNRHLFVIYHTVRDQIELEDQLRTAVNARQALAYGIGLLAGVGLLIAGVASPAVAFLLQLLMLLACVNLVWNVRSNTLDAVIARDRTVATDIVTKYMPQIWKTESPIALRTVTELLILDLERKRLTLDLDLYNSGHPSVTTIAWPSAVSPAGTSGDGEVGPVVCVWLFAASLLGLTHAVYQQSWPVALACAFAAHLLALTWWAITRPLPVRTDPA